MGLLRSSLDVVSFVLAGFAAAAVGFTVLANVAEVVARYFFGSPLNWAGDLSAFALCLTIFLALPEVTRRHAHTALTLIIERMSPDRARAYQATLFFLTAIVCALVAWFVGEVALDHYQRGVLTPTTNQIPRWWLSGTIFLGLALSALNFVVFARGAHEDTSVHTG